MPKTQTSRNKNNWRNIAQKVKIVPTFEVEIYLLYQGPSKKLERKKQKKLFAKCRPTWHSAKAVALADPKPATWQAFVECLALSKGGSFAECLTVGHSAKETATDAVCPGPLCRVPFAECGVWHSAKSLFVECPRFATRQRLRYSAKPPFPVVSIYPLDSEI
jgi:hypothetical protein